MALKRVEIILNGLLGSHSGVFLSRCLVLCRDNGFEAFAQQFQRPVEGFGVAGALSFVREGAALRCLTKERVEGGGQCVDSCAVARRYLEEGAAAVAGNGIEVASERFGTGQIAFVDDEEVGHLDETGLHGLDVVAESGRENEGCQVGEAHDVEFGLSDAHGLDDDRVAAEELHQARGRGGGR